MWFFLRKLVSGSTTANLMFGEVVFVTPREHGAFAHSFFEWRVKAAVDESQVHIGLAMRADAYAGVEGSPTNYMQFDLETAERLRDRLNDCIDFVRRQSKGSA
jgi:hypothetical protein